MPLNSLATSPRMEQMRKPPESPPEHLDRAIEEQVLRDLEPPASVVQAKVGTATIVGGVLSMLTCGQFGIGFTSFARAFSHNLHEHMGPLSCALICGLLYAIFPVSILRFALCTTLQFKSLVRRRQWSIAAWFGGVGVTLAAFGHHGTGLAPLTAWLASALLSTYVLSRLVETLPSKREIFDVRS